jgi:hypothetical protein
MRKSVEAVKKAVRERAGNRCAECGMTTEEHKRRFGKNLDVHRKNFWGPWSYGPYEVKKAVALCDLCHRAKHSLKCAIRKRDGYICTECGMTDEEHRKVYGSPLPVHCVRPFPFRLVRDDECDQSLRGKHKVNLNEYITLCRACHHAKHSIKPAVLKRDGFQCTDCGKRPEDNRLWYPVVRVHRLSGDCEEDCGPDADPSGFITLCIECHETRHPDRLAESVQYAGGQVMLPKPIEEFADKLGITLPITSKYQLATYKQYLLVVNFFIDHFRKNGFPTKRGLRRGTLSLPGSGLSAFLHRKAAEEAIDEISREIHCMPTADRKRMAKMNDQDKAAFLGERKERHLDFVMKRNAEPTVGVSTGRLQSRVRI